MKKIRMIITGTCVLAIVGSALAFVPKFNDDFCTFATTQGASCLNQTCDTKLTGQKTGSTNYFCTAPVPTNGSCASVTCDNAAPINLVNQH